MLSRPGPATSGKGSATAIIDRSGGLEIALESVAAANTLIADENLRRCVDPVLCLERIDFRPRAAIESVDRPRAYN